jgi:hypothetical protein
MLKKIVDAIILSTLTLLGLAAGLALSFFLLKLMLVKTVLRQ